jgi:hypothetical protein
VAVTGAVAAYEGDWANREPLLVDDNGAAWAENGIKARSVAAAARLQTDATAYSLRPSFITNCLLKGIPVRLVDHQH